MLNYQETFKQVLEIENTTEILDFAVPDINVLLWPYVRFTILQQCINELISHKNIHLANVKKENTISRMKFFAKTAWNCFKPWPKRDIFLLNSAGSEYHKFYNEKLYNIYQEPYAEIFPEQTLYLDASNGPEFITSKKFSLRRTAPMDLIAGKMTKYMSSAKHENNIKSFLRFIEYRIKHALSIEFSKDFYINLQERLLYLSKYLIAERKILNLVLPKKAPKLCIIQCAHHGGDGNIIKFMKERGAVVAENQHGLIFNNIFAYNWSATLLNDDRLKKQSPDILLTYGNYWQQFFHGPGKCYTLGNAWFDICQQEASDYTGENAILFALNENYDAFASIISHLQKAFPHQEIIIRPHPHQREYFQSHEVANLPNVNIDTCQNIYETFQKASVVIGTSSTSLFEAAALGKRTFIYKNIYSSDFSEEYFEHFANLDELVAKLKEPWSMPENVKDVFFNKNWKENYISFVNQYS